jgi:hypothetical protein
MSTANDLMWFGVTSGSWWTAHGGTHQHLIGRYIFGKYFSNETISPNLFQLLGEGCIYFIIKLLGDFIFEVWEHAHTNRHIIVVSEWLDNCSLRRRPPKFFGILFPSSVMNFVQFDLVWHSVYNMTLFLKESLFLQEHSLALLLYMTTCMHWKIIQLTWGQTIYIYTCNWIPWTQS